MIVTLRIVGLRRKVIVLGASSGLYVSPLTMSQLGRNSMRCVTHTTILNESNKTLLVSFNLKGAT